MNREPKTHAEIYHVYFNGELRPRLHVCDFHRSIADNLFACDETDPDGDCPHVQYGQCGCQPVEFCSICPTPVRTYLAR